MKATKLIALLLFYIDAISAFISKISKPKIQANRAISSGVYHEVEKMETPLIDQALEMTNMLNEKTKYVNQQTPTTKQTLSVEVDKEPLNFDETMTNVAKKALSEAQTMLNDSDILLQKSLGKTGKSWCHVSKALTALHNVAGASLFVVQGTILDAEYNILETLESLNERKKEWTHVTKALTTFYNVVGASLQVLEESLHDAYIENDGKLGTIEDEKHSWAIIEGIELNRSRLFKDIKELHHIQRMFST